MADETKPSQTTVGREWLKNFRDSERETAVLLVDSLCFVSTGTIRNELEAALRSDSRYQQPMALYPIRSLSDFPGPLPEAPIVFDHFDPAAPLNAAPGSEALAAQLLRTLARAHPGHVLGPNTTKRDLKAARCRSIVFVEDYAGSGDQALEYLSCWLRNRTLRSWQSLGWLRFHLLLHSVAPQAWRRLKSVPALASFTRISTARTIDSAGWTEQQRKQVLKLCRSYSIDRDLALGHIGSGGLLVMQHTAPDNLPMILWQTGGRTADNARWRPLLPGRGIPGSLATLAAAGYTPPLDYTTAAERLDDGGATASLVEGAPAEQKRFFFVLGACISGVRQPDRLAAESRTQLRSIQATLDTLLRWRYVDAKWRPTERGRRAFALHARRVALPRVSLHGSGEPYYPRALRES